MDSKADAVGTSLDQYKKAAHASAGRIAARTIVAAVPYAGSSILELWNGIAQQRTEARLNTVFERMKEWLGSIDKEKVDRAFFDSEEFQTLLYLLIEKLHTTHDEEKLRMFGTALANCANTGFKGDDKEQYVRTLRDLSLKDLQVLKEVAAASGPAARLPSGMVSALLHRAGFADIEKPSISRLLGLGLVIETLKMRDFDPRVPVIPTSQQSPERYTRALTEVFRRYFQQPPAREYAVSEFGRRFLDFIASTDHSTSENHEPVIK